MTLRKKEKEGGKETRAFRTSLFNQYYLFLGFMNPVVSYSHTISHFLQLNDV